MIWQLKNGCTSPRPLNFVLKEVSFCILFVSLFSSSSSIDEYNM